MATIDILLATYNGARFLPEQLASLAAQTYPNWRVILRDDGSSDGSEELVKRWAREGGHDLVVLEDGRRNLGAKGNFAALLEASDAPYFACCDQDDIWLPDKLALMLVVIKAAEAATGAEMPLLVYSDLEVVDAKLNLIHPSFRKYASVQHLPPGGEVVHLMSQNSVIGCALLGNSTLREVALPIPAQAVMHDWWLALVAAGVGKLIDLPEATVRYRNHGANASGPVNWDLYSLFSSIIRNPLRSAARARKFCLASQMQAQALQKHCAHRLENSKATIIETYGAMSKKRFLVRKLYALVHLPIGGTMIRRLSVILFL